MAGNICLCVNSDILNEYEEVLAAKTTYFVTNDSHFNVLKQIDWPKLAILSIKEFLMQINNGG